MSHTLVIADYKKAIRAEVRDVWQRFSLGMVNIRKYRLLIKQLRTANKIAALTTPSNKVWKVSKKRSVLDKTPLNYELTK